MSSEQPFSNFSNDLVVYDWGTCFVLFHHDIDGRGAPWSAPFQFLSPTIGTLLRLALEWLPNSPERLGLDCRRYCSATVHKSSQELRAANRVDFISYMVGKARVDETGAPLTDAQVGAVAIEFILAGSETAATTLGYITYYLSKYPEVSTSWTSDTHSPVAHHRFG